MYVNDLFSRIQKQRRGEKFDVYRYDVIPTELRTQIWYIMFDAASHYNKQHAASYSNDITMKIFDFITEILRREHGKYNLAPDGRDSNRTGELQSFVMEDNNIDRVLDAVLLTFRYIRNLYTNGPESYCADGFGNLDSLSDELNKRFNDHGVGFRLVNDDLVRIDSEFLHSEAVIPSLALLRDSYYEGAEQEFLSAHDHYRHRRHKEALVDALKAFESTMKVVCSKRGWQVDSNATASKLVEACLANGLFPGYHDQHLANLRALLSSCVPTVRNKAGGHGQGGQVVEVPAHLASFVLHSTASAILLMVESEKALPSP